VTLLPAFTHSWGHYRAIYPTRRYPAGGSCLRFPPPGPQPPTQRAATVVAFHEGRGEQEGLIGELKADCGVDRVPAKRLVANQIHLLTSLIAHNIGRELQISAGPEPACNTVHRAALWTCHELSTLRRQLLWQPARVLRPNGKLTLALGANTTMKERFLGFWHALARAQQAASQHRVFAMLG